MNSKFCYERGGNLSKVDIQREMQNGNIFIAPYAAEQLQPAGYNLTPTRFVYSTKRKRLMPIIDEEEETYVMIDKNDTVLVKTRETIMVSEIMTGAFYSKVKVVSQGFGHVSTTLDPNWKGQLLISINNPTDKKIKFSIEKNVYGKIIHNTFVTLEFSYLNIATECVSDNPPDRNDILDLTIEKDVSLFKRGRIEELSNLVKELHRHETKSLETLIYLQLNEGEKEEWNAIEIISDEPVFNEKKREFIQTKRTKYLRKIQKEFLLHAEKSIEIIDEYVSKKQKWYPLKKRFFRFLMKHLYELAGFVIATVLVIMFILEKTDKIVFGITGDGYFTIIIGYIVLPILGNIWDYINNQQ